MPAAARIYIIGIGYKPLDRRGRGIVIASDIILTFSRLLEIFKGYAEFPTVKDKIRVVTDGDEIIALIRDNKTAVITILASGDPLFHGIGRKIIGEFGKDMVEILPDVSCVQLAFAKIKESWDDAVLISLHGHGDSENKGKLEDIPLLLQRYKKVAVLTNKGNHPAEIARFLDTLRLPLKMYIVQRLGYADESIIEGCPGDIAQMKFLEPNMVIIIVEEKY